MEAGQRHFEFQRNGYQDQKNSQNRPWAQHQILLLKSNSQSSKNMTK
tara:strand:+ start:170 stop:310 length:141 start_codon:yes stop_codon:yes gene_type:complete